MSKTHRFSVLSLAFFAYAAVAAIPGETLAAAPAKGSLDVLAPVPSVPGFPEGIAIDNQRVFVSGPATFGTAGTGPSVIHVFHKQTGALLDTLVLQGEDLSQEHALVGMALGDHDSLFALSTQLGVVRFDRCGNHFSQSIYAPPLPDLPTCSAAAPGEACSPTTLDLPPIPNDIVFDAEGNAYITDSSQATIFRVAPGGEPEIWFQSALFDPPSPPFPTFSLNGIRLSPERDFAYAAVTFFGAGFPMGAIVRIPVMESPAESDVEMVHPYFFEAPDGIAFDEEGRLYVALAGTNEISVLSPDGSEEARYGTPAGAAIPLDAPASIAFDSAKKSILMTNHALFSGDASHFAVLRMYVGEKGDRLERPELP